MLETKDFFLLDGGLSTALEDLGVRSLNSNLWTGELLRESQDKIRAAHNLFVNAGSTVLISSSYQISFNRCIEKGWSPSEVYDALTNSTNLARFEGVKVAASVGPYGAYLADGSEYRGNYGLSIAQLKDFHRERLSALVASSPDYLAVETIPEIAEARAIIELIVESHITIPYWVSFSCRNETEISSGEKFADCIELLNSAKGAFAVGVNCTRPEYVSSLLMSAPSRLPFVVYPNLGRNWDPIKKC